MPMPVPTATPEPMTLSQEEVDKLLEGLDVNSIIENTIAAIEENPIFRAVRTQTLRDGGIEIFDTLYEYTGDYDAPYTAQGTHLTPSIGRIYEFDSTWRSTCVRKIAPSVERRLYYEHDDWWKIGPNAERLVPPIPFFPLIPNFGGWEAVDLHRQSGPLELVLRTVLPNGLSYTVHIYPEAHPFRVVVEKSYFGDRLLSDTTYFYDTEEGPVVHESEEDCLSRNAG